jgi:hypothetical protein
MDLHIRTEVQINNGRKVMVNTIVEHDLTREDLNDFVNIEKGYNDLKSYFMAGYDKNFTQEEKEKEYKELIEPYLNKPEFLLAEIKVICDDYDQLETYLCRKYRQAINKAVIEKFETMDLTIEL